jgi:hypothetical protein
LNVSSPLIFFVLTSQRPIQWIVSIFAVAKLPLYAHLWNLYNLEKQLDSSYYTIHLRIFGK